MVDTTSLFLVLKAVFPTFAKLGEYPKHPGVLKEMKIVKIVLFML
jgi:hypothetical protein